MRIAVIADIHSNIYSLNEVLLDIDCRNADLYDYVKQRGDSMNVTLRLSLHG